MTFAAIDFETATYDMHSACAVGIVTVVNGIITDEYHTLIQPPDNLYSYQNIRIHGINGQHTWNKGTFADYYPEIHQRLQGRIVVAHNEGFDRSVLRSCIAHYRLSSKGLLLHKNWECTVQLSRNLGYYPNKLSDCCTRHNIPLQHHEALSDARACAQLYLIFKRANHTGT
jgi:DNA polymerase III subunit epsilon